MTTHALEQSRYRSYLSLPLVADVDDVVACKRGPTTKTGAVRPRPHSVAEQSTVIDRVSFVPAVSRSNYVRTDRRADLAKPDCTVGDQQPTTRHRRGSPPDISPGHLWYPRRKQPVRQRISRPDIGIGEGEPGS